MLFYSAAALLLIIIDQITKILVSANFTDTTTVAVIDGVFNLVYLKNTGAAFSLLTNHASILAVVSVLFCIALIIYAAVRKPSSKLQKTSLTLIFAGAAGNAIDRVFRGYVIDFIEPAFIDFPVFNIADISITVGAALLIIFVIFFDKQNNR